MSLHFGSQDEGAAWAAGLPWELLCSPEEKFLALDQGISIVRYLDGPWPPEPPPLPSPVRILIVRAEPEDLPSLELEDEETALRRVLNQAAPNALDVEKLSRPTRDQLRERLALTSNGPFHIVHFLGHGAVDVRSGQGVLYLENEDGTSEGLDGQALHNLFPSIQGPGLVVLNACETATSPGGSMGSVATSLVAAGIPAVVAMQFSVLDQSATRFGKALYTELASGAGLDSSVMAGRKAMGDKESMEWANPALFLRLRDGRIWKAEENLSKYPRIGPGVRQRVQAALHEAEDLEIVASQGKAPKTADSAVEQELRFDELRTTRSLFIAHKGDS